MSTKFLIGEAAQYLGISRDTLRYYDKEDVLKPSIIGENGYRYYIIEDIIKLVYIITFRQLDMSIKEIKNMITHCTLEELEILMKEKEEEIENKIEKLISLKETVNNFKNDINKSIRLLNKIEITESPYILYEEIENDMDLNTQKIIKKLDNSENINTVIFSSIIKKEFFYLGNLEKNISYAISGIKSDSTPYSYEEEYNIFNYNKCIHSIFNIAVDIYEKDVQYIRDYINEKNIEVYDNSIARFITFENKSNKSYDYLEIWIPIK